VNEMRQNFACESKTFTAKAVRVWSIE